MWCNDIIWFNLLNGLVMNQEGFVKVLYTLHDNTYMWRSSIFQLSLNLRPQASSYLLLSHLRNHASQGLSIWSRCGLMKPCASPVTPQETCRHHSVDGDNLQKAQWPPQWSWFPVRGRETVVSLWNCKQDLHKHTVFVEFYVGMNEWMNRLPVFVSHRCNDRQKEKNKIRISGSDAACEAVFLHFYFGIFTPTLHLLWKAENLRCNNV